MYITTVKVKGMMCGMCEAHVSDAVRKTFSDAKKVSASRKKETLEFLSEEIPDPEMLRKAITETGYEYISEKTEPYVKKGLFRR